MNTEEVWTKTLAQIEVKLDSNAQFKTWFKDTRLTEIDGKYAVIQVKNPYTSDWLKSRHEKLITDTISYVTGKPLKIKFEINGMLVSEDVVPMSAELEIEQNPLLFHSDGMDTETMASIQNAGLNEKYTIESYVVAEPNRMAHAAALAVIDGPGQTYNPLFIYGPSGVGKTHLAQAVGLSLLQRNPNRKVVYSAAEAFLNDFVKSIRKGKTIENRQKYRKIDCLIIDDIQLISQWEKTQDEFFNTFNELYNANKQIVLVSDRKPEDIKSIDARLRTRFMGGLTVDISRPDYAMRLAVLERKAAEKGLQIPAHVVEYLAKQIPENVRELEGAIQKVSLYNNMKRDGTPLTVNEIMNIIGHDARTKRDKVSLSKILKHVADEFNVKVADLKGERRTAEVAFARQVTMYILRKEFEYKLERIAAILNRKDHTTVIHAIDKIESKIALSEGFAEQIVRLKELIRNSEEPL
jgi:chromosomal replication initiator protein